jgi:hypothetical protein
MEHQSLSPSPLGDTINLIAVELCRAARWLSNDTKIRIARWMGRCKKAQSRMEQALLLTTGEQLLDQVRGMLRTLS